MPGCIVKQGTPHDCKGKYACDHGLEFPTHEPDGSFCFASDYCEECRAECAAEQGKLDHVMALLEEAEQRCHHDQNCTQA